MKTKQFLTHTKAPTILTALMIGTVSLTAIHTIPNPPPPAGGLQNTDHFVLFADQTLSFEENATISSGDLGTNGNLDIRKGTNITGNLFADTITIDKNTSINGNATFNKLSNNGEILGTKTTPIKLPIANLPTIPSFTIGTQDQTITGNTTLPAGNYRDLTLKKNAKLTLSGGTYNLREFELEENATLVFTAPTVLNIQSKLKGRDNVSILNGQNAKHDDLHINYLGSKQKQDKDDDDPDADDKKDMKENKTGRPVTFGKNSLLNFTLLAPNASVKIEKDSIVRGQIIARSIKAGKGFIGSKEEVFSQPTDISKIIMVEGEKFPVNEIMVVLKDSAVFSDAQAIANSLQGTITGFIPTPQIYKIKVPTTTAVELDALIVNLQNRNNSLVLFVSKNLVTE